MQVAQKASVAKGGQVQLPVLQKKRGSFTSLSFGAAAIEESMLISSLGSGKWSGNQISIRASSCTSSFGCGDSHTRSELLHLDPRRQRNE